EDLVLAHHQQVFAVDLDGVAAGVRTEHHLVTDLDGQRTDFAVVQNLAGTDGDDLALVRLLGSRTRQHDAASGLGLFFAATDDDAVMQRTKLHCRSLLLVVFTGRRLRRRVRQCPAGPDRGTPGGAGRGRLFHRDGGNLAVNAR